MTSVFSIIKRVLCLCDTRQEEMANGIINMSRRIPKARKNLIFILAIALYATILLHSHSYLLLLWWSMPEFYKISFDADELDALKKACALLSEDEDRKLDEATSGDLETVAWQRGRADDILLIKSTVSIFKPGQSILITSEDLGLLRKSLERLGQEAPDGTIDSAIKKINNVKPAPI